MTITGANDAPIVVGESLATDHDSPLTIPAASLLTNDHDADGDVLAVVGVTNAVSGTVSLENGVITFTPASGFDGAAGFDYAVADDHGGETLAHVSIAVAPRNHTPVAANDAVAAYEMQVQQISVASLLANDTDADAGDTITLVSVATASIRGASISLVDGEILYDPGTLFNYLDTGDVGLDTFTYTVCDAAGVTSTATAIISVQGLYDAARAHDDSFVGRYAPSLSFSVLSNDDVLSYSVGSVALAIGDAPIHGQATVYTTPQGMPYIVYTPNGYQGADQFTYKVWGTDGVVSIGTMSIELIGQQVHSATGGNSPDNFAAYNMPEYFSGYDGTDCVSYVFATSGITASLEIGAGLSGSYALGDFFYSIENLTGSDFDDYLVGDSGNNILTGGAGSDQLYGLSGDDILEGSAGSDYLSGGQGVDWADYSHAESADGFGINVGLAYGGTYGEAKGDTLVDIENILGSAYDDYLEDDAGDNILVGGGGNDQLYSSGGNDTLVGGEGGDYLYAAAGVQYLDGGAGNDDVEAYDGSGSVIGGDGNDVLVGAGGDYTLDGGTGDDYLYAVDGNSILTGGRGQDEFDFAGTGQSVITDFAVGISGDRIYVENAADIDNEYAVEVSDYEGGTRIKYGNDLASAVNLAGVDVITLSAANFVSVPSLSFARSSKGISFDLNETGNPFGAVTDVTGAIVAANMLIGNSPANIMTGGNADDTLIGNGGDDLLNGGSGNDVAEFSGSRAQYVITKVNELWTVFDTMAGRDGIDTLTDIETLHFADQSVAINSLSGIAVNSARANVDTAVSDYYRSVSIAILANDLVDGAGSLNWEIETSPTHGVLAIKGSAIIYTPEWSYQGIDRVTYRLLGADGVVTAATVLIAVQGSIITGTASNDTLNSFSNPVQMVGGAGPDQLKGGMGAQAADYSTAPGAVAVSLATGTGSLGDANGDVLTDIENLIGSAYADTLVGNAGSNVLVGGAGNDMLTGGAGGDTLAGDSGNDTLAGGSGSDLLIGGDGNDTYVFNAGDGHDLVDNQPGNSGADKVQIGSSNIQLWLDRSGDDLDIRILGTQDRLTIDDWFVDSSHQVAAVVSSNGFALGNNAVDQLVTAMAAFEAGYAASHNGLAFDPTNAANATMVDPTVLAAVNNAWHAAV
jgi:Ca2+-binding RTX toxin-like protein